MTLSRPFKEDRLALSLLSLSPPGDRWCDAFGFVHLKHLNTSGTPIINPLGRVALPAGVEKFPFWLVIYIKHSIHFIRHQQFKGVRRWMSTTDTFQSGLLFPCFTFCSKVIESQVDGMCGLTVIS